MDWVRAMETIQQEIAQALSGVQESDIQALITALLKARRIFVVGTGRVGLAAQAFAMRLMHLGLPAYWIGDVTTPSVGPADLLLVCSGSGETAPVRVLAELAARQGAEIATVTRQPQASISRLARAVVRLMPTTQDGSNTPPSAQPMTSLFEQSLFLLFDAVVLLLMERIGQTEVMMQQRHFNLER
jgi:6-phospho-3-hexuloisomerase